jgi:pimeloyl-[acyl-carrier protein] methyl ester esterase
MATLEILEGDYRALWAQVKKPALHLLGSADALVPASLADGLEEIVPDHDVVMFNSAGHLPFLAFPQAFVESLAIFARGLARDE